MKITALFNAMQGVGSGTLILMSTIFNNPDNVPANDIKGNPHGKPFDYEVAKNFPTSMKYISYIFMGIFAIVLILMPNIPPPVESDTP